MSAAVPGDTAHAARTLSKSSASPAPSSPRGSIHSALATGSPAGTTKMAPEATKAINEEPKELAHDDVAPKYEAPADASAAPASDVKKTDFAAGEANGHAPEASTSAGAGAPAAAAEAEPAAAAPKSREPSVAAPKSREPSVVVASPTGTSAPMSPLSPTGTVGSKMDQKAIKESLKRQSKYEKVLKSEEKSDGKRLDAAVKEADRAGKAEAHATKMESKAKSKLSSAEKREYKTNKAYSKAKEKHDKATAELEAAKETFRLKSEHREQLAAERTAALDRLDKIRSEKTENDIDRVQRRTASENATRSSMIVS